MKSKRKLLEQMVDDVQLQILGNEVNTRTLKKKVENNITSFEQALKCLKLWDINNGRTLCLNCHKIVTKNQVLKRSWKSIGK